jgi:hypothetical protein
MEDYEEQKDRYIRLMEKQLDEEKINRMQQSNAYGQLSSFQPNKELNLVEYQLDLKEEMDRIQHLLSGHVLDRDSEGNEVWKEPDDDRLKIFSDYGVKQIMNILQFYINRTTILSKYDHETIMWKVRDFGIELSDLLMNRYEALLYYPSPEDLFDKYLPSIKSLNLSEEELYYKCVQWSNEELKNKIRHCTIIAQAIIDLVHSTYLRAEGGEERRTLRQFIHVSQSTNMSNPIPSGRRPFSFFKPSTWKKQQ